MLRDLYAWMMRQTAGPHAERALAVVSFLESSVFPVPPDAMLVPMVLARPQAAWRTALVATAASVAGGLLGYLIGYALLGTVGEWIIRLYGLGDRLAAFQAAYAQWGLWIILIKGLTPIPYKLVTITSGFAGYDLFWFTVLSIVTRGARFFFLAAILGRFGPAIKGVIETHFNKVMAGIAVTIVGGFVAFRYLF